MSDDIKKVGINVSKIYEFNELEDAAPGSIELIAREFDHPALDKLMEILGKYGDRVKRLTIGLSFPQRPFDHNLLDFDFARCCPELTFLCAERCIVNSTVLIHPKLTELKLVRCWLHTSHPFRLGYQDSPVSHVKSIQLEDVNWRREESSDYIELALGPLSQLEKISYSGDEDDMETYPERLIFDNCPKLEEVSIHICGTWDLVFKGTLPKLNDLTASSSRYGCHSFDFSQVADNSSQHLLDYRDGKGPCKNQVYYISEQYNNRDFDVKKFKYLVTTLGGKLVDKLSSEVTCLVLGENEFEEFENEKDSGSPLVGEALQLNKKGANIQTTNSDGFFDIYWDFY